MAKDHSGTLGKQLNGWRPTAKTMREIKFRAWNTKTKEMGVPFQPLQKTYMQDNKSLWPDGMVFMQYTGLKDKNGKEIYEGDMFQCISGTGATMMQGKIYFDDGCFRMKYGYQKPKKNDRKDYFLSCSIDYGVTKTLEVVGNIYENPELR